MLEIILGVAVLDRLTKLLAASVMTEGMSIPVIPGVFHFTYVLNPGAAFGLLKYQRLFFVGITVVVAIAAFLLRDHIRQEGRLTRWGAAFFLGGAVGNMIDRIHTGYAIDFFDFLIWPVFNVADIFICVGVGMIVWSTLKKDSGKTGKTD